MAESCCALPALISRFGDKITGALFIANQGGEHWVAGRLDLETGTCEIYDSLQASGEVALELQQGLDRAFARLLPEAAIREWVFALMPCPQQPNTQDCGVFALVTIWHLATSVRLPDTNTCIGSHWRRVFVALASANGSSLAAQLPPALTDDVNNLVLPIAENQAASQVQDPMDTMLAQAHQLKMRLEQSCTFWAQRRYTAEATIRYLRTSVSPLVSAWLESASSVDLAETIASRLEDVSEEQRRYEELKEHSMQLSSEARRRSGQELVPGFLQKQIVELDKCVRVSKQARARLVRQRTVVLDGKQRLSSLYLDEVIAELRQRAMTCRILEQKALTAYITIRSTIVPPDEGDGIMRRHRRESSWSY